MTLIHDFKKRLENTETDVRKTITPSNDAPVVSEKVIQLADRFVMWHRLQPLPERWEPQQLGRIAATFGVPRELMAAALKHAGWVEHKTGATSYWQRSR
ncbi:hypothetical protein SAMN05192566_1449 [Methylophilus rhizosphaerae]|uniref:Uncharacterized protein n=1 Tax=Methylophilus rhizosphaerae TaxID=492660 RepID=A0A1G9CGW1_9PROT|nr:hypothetical protein SAMN05192566_1449 [Methylophilus rhizosphaerae]